MNRITTHVCAGLIALSAITARGAPGDIDPSFIASNNSNCGYGASLVSSDSGAIFISCTVTTGEWQVIKFHADGTRDARWGNLGVVRLPSAGSRDIWYAGMDPDGGFRLVSTHGHTLRLRSDGSRDPGFATLSGYQSAALFVNPAGYYGQQTPDLYNMSLHTLPDGSMVTLNFVTDLQPPTYVVRRLPADGNVGYPIPELRYQMRDGASTLGPVAWSLLPDDSLELLLPDYHPAGTSFQIVGDMRLYRALPGGVAVVQPDRTFPARGVVNAVSSGFHVFGDGSKMLEQNPFQAVVKWLADNRIDPAFGVEMNLGVHAKNLQGPYLKNVSIIANAGLVVYYCGPRFIGPMGYTVCEGMYSSPRLSNGRADVSRQNAFSELGTAYRVSIAFDGGIVTLDTNLQRFQGHGPRADTTVVEYYHAGLDHYFMTATPAEIDDLDSGVGPGWKRTGHRFGAWNIDTPMPNTEPVCRFYGDLSAGPNSHFYSAEKFECDILAAQEAAAPIGRRAWRFERNGFRITVPVAGKCLEALVPVRRVYNRAGPGKDPNHRYLTSESEFQAMLAKGWVDEGVHMCATPNLQ